MSLEIWLSNLWFYSLQTGILILVGGLLAWIFRLREPGGIHLYWRLLLAGCLMLAFQPGVPESLPDPAIALTLGESVFPVSPVGNVQARPVANMYPWLGGLLISGILLRLVWLGIGFRRLHRLKLRTRHLPLPRHLRMMKERLDVSARFRVSSEVSGPITFGILQPVVVFPEAFTELDESMQSAVACHELLHVKRRDWVWNTLDELVRTFFWFHPGFHWLVGRIQLTREQVVDEQAVTLLGSRQIYLRSLVEIAKRRNSTALPAPLFLKESQLSRRVQLLLRLREVRMSKARKNISMAVGLALLAVIGWWSLSALPLTAAQSTRLPESEPAVQEPILVGSNVMKRKLIHRVDPEYLSHLTIARPSGLVILSVVVGKQGEVQQVEVVQPDKDKPAMDSAAMDAVRQWRYEPYLLDGQPIRVRTTVFLRFPPSGIFPQIFKVKKEIWRETESALKNTERALKNTEYLMNGIAQVFPHAMGEKEEIRGEFERVRKKFERVASEMARIDLQMLLDKRKVVLGEMARARKVMDGVRREIERVTSEMTGLALETRESGNSSGP